MANALPIRAYRLAFATVIVLVAGGAHGQTFGSLEVRFQGGPAAPIAGVPISPWIVGCIAVGLALLASNALWRTRNAKSTTRVWLAVLAFALAAGDAFHSGSFLEQAQADVPAIPFPLVASPATITIESVPGSYLATNETGATITLTRVIPINPATCEAIYVTPTSCLIGTVLAPAQSCTISLTYMFEPCI